MLAAVCIYHKTIVINFLEPAKLFAGRAQDNAQTALNTGRGALAGLGSERCSMNLPAFCMMQSQKWYFIFRRTKFTHKLKCKFAKKF